VNTKKGGVDFKGEEGMNFIHEEDDEELDDSSFALRDRSIESQPNFEQGFIAPDEDPDMSIYFTTPQSLLDHLANLEEDNLFKIHLVQEDEQALEEQKRKIEENIKDREKEILEVKKNIEIFEHSRQAMLNK
jgi:hypothetical protein